MSTKSTESTWKEASGYNPKSDHTNRMTALTTQQIVRTSLLIMTMVMQIPTVSCYNDDKPFGFANGPSFEKDVDTYTVSCNFS